MNTQINLNTHGKVRPSKKVIVTARINGSVNWISPLLSEGQFFKDGDLLLTIDAQSNSNLNYTLVKAPFNGVVQSRNVDLGQNVNNGHQLAVLLGSDSAEVISEVPMNRLEWIMNNNLNKSNSYQLSAEISMKIGEMRASWQGTLERHLLELTPNGMMVQLILSIKDPFRLQFNNDEVNKTKIPLFIGSFVDKFYF